MKVILRTLALAISILTATSNTGSAGTGALNFDGVNDYVTLGPATNINNLGVTNFTIECWFKRQGAGKRGFTGSGGIYALPLVTKGMAEGEAARTNMNYFFGVGTNALGQTVLAADFEDFNNGLNHPVIGNTVWVHGAVTYDVASSNWTLYVNGALDASTNILGQNGSPITNALQLIPRYDSLQHAALASCLRSIGTTNTDSGFFGGALDEVRIWNYARSAAQIAADYNAPITNATGLIARWGLDESSGSVSGNSVSGGVSGSFTNGTAAWTNGYFVPPTVAIVNPANNALISANSITIEATASDSEGSVAKVEFFLGNTLLGDDVTDPFSFTLNDVAPGNYTLKAVATDNIGLTATSSVVNITITPPPGVGGLYFDGVNDYVKFGAATSMGVSNFTVECWFKQQGAGKRSNTGTGGINAIPLVTKGMAEAENSTVDCNWFFGIGTNNSGQAVLAADFEDFNNGLNHPVRGSMLVSSNIWQHAAVTYDVASSNWTIYLNGVLDVYTNVLGLNGSAITNVLQLLPRYDSIQHAALGTSLLSSGNTNSSSGFFAGTMDEVRVWNYARSAQDIAGYYQAQIPSASGLIARWSLDDTAGLAATNSGTSGVNGALTNGPVWVEGYTFASAPTITSQPGSTNINCGDNVSFSVTATGPGTLNYQWYFDNAVLSGETNASLSLIAVTGANAGSYLVTVQNIGGSITSSPAALTITDSTPPIISICATGAVLSANANCQAAIPDLTGQVVASDVCSAVTISQSPAAGTLVGLGNTLVTITVTDAATNTASCNATVTVNDTAAPTITACATNISLSADANCQAIIPDLTMQVAATDACSAVTTTQSPLAGTLVGIGSHLVTLTATDAANNSDTCSATITVVDVTAPTITLCATNVTLNADTNCQATVPDLTAQVIATDSCGSVMISQSPTAGTIVGLGNTLVTLTVADTTTNLTTCSATITVVDLTAPIITTCATNMTLNADTYCQAAIPDLTAQVVAGDSCSSVTVSQSPLAGTLVGLGNTLVTLTVTDTATNLATCSATITVLDATAPIIATCATNMTLNGDTNCQAMIPDLTSQVVASDPCGSVTITQSPIAGTLVGLGNTLVTLTVTDGANNQSTCSATIMVVDGFAPVITTQPLSQTNLVGSTATFTVAATSCSTISYQWMLGTNTLSGETNPTLTITNIQLSHAGDYTVVAANSVGNTTSAIATLTVLSPIAPVLSSGPVILPNGHFQVGYTGTPGVPYTIEWAAAVTGPWQSLTNITSDINGLIGCEDFTVPAPPVRFYRVVYP